MVAVVKTRLVKIGNSQGIRIPKLLLDQLNLTGEVELEVEDDQLVVRSVKAARCGWEEQFRLMAEQGDDRPLDTTTAPLTTWDDEEWEW
jgi:antitoxin MazE